MCTQGETAPEARERPWQEPRAPLQAPGRGLQAVRVRRASVLHVVRTLCCSRPSARLGHAGLPRRGCSSRWGVGSCRAGAPPVLPCQNPSETTGLAGPRGFRGGSLRPVTPALGGGCPGCCGAQSHLCGVQSVLLQASAMTPGHTGPRCRSAQWTVLTRSPPGPWLSRGGPSG